MPTQKYMSETVVDASRRRIARVFDIFENIVVSVSGGKDSTILAWLSIKEAEKRNRKIGLFFLDEELVYQSTIDQVEWVMGLSPELVSRLWLQVEFNLTNAISSTETQFRCWESGKHKEWMRPKGKNNIAAPMWGKNPTIRDRRKGFGFYDVIDNFESCYQDTAFLVGLRATESPNRFRAVSKNPVKFSGEFFFWGTKKDRGCASFYPIYDWNFHDVWKFTAENNIRYSRIYDLQFKKGMKLSEIRCSSLVHERSFKSICELPEFEPKTYARLLKRAKGISLAQEAGKNPKLFGARSLPKNHKSWVEYRNFLLSTHQDDSAKKIFVKRFSGHRNNEFVARQQCRQLILNDYENNVAVINKEDPREELRKYYKSVL